MNGVRGPAAPLTRGAHTGGELPLDLDAPLVGADLVAYELAM